MAKPKSFRFSEDIDKFLEEQAKTHKVSIKEYIEALARKEMSSKEEKPKTLSVTKASDFMKPMKDVPPEGVKTSTSIATDAFKRRAKYPYDKFMYPIGNTINVVKPGTGPGTGRPIECMWRVDTWWCPPHKLKEVSERAKVWEENGFMFYVGTEDGGTDRRPHVIMDESQEHGRNKRYCPNRKLVPALIGDVMVWLEIKDPQKALRFMEKRTDIPCAVVYDYFLYEEDNVYRQAVDKALQYFIHYFEYGEPYKLYDEEDSYGV